MNLITFRELENILLTAMKTPTMSIKYVSRETGIGQSGLYKWVNGYNRISPDNADILLNWLKDVRPDVLEAAILIYTKGANGNEWGRFKIL